MHKLIKELFPKGLAILVIMHLLVIYSIVSVSSTLIFYCQDVIKYDVTEAGQFFAAAFALLWGLDILGGYLGSKLNHKQTIIFGLLLLTLGLFVISVGNKIPMYIGLSAIIVGFVLAIPNINLCIAHLYDKNDEKLRSSGFTLSQFGVNIGSVLGAVAAGYIINIFGYKEAYSLAAIFPMCALIIFLMCFRSFKLKSDSTFLEQSRSNYNPYTTTKLFLIILLAWWAVFLVLVYYTIANKLLLSLIVIASVLIFRAIMKEPTQNRKKLYLLFAVFCVSIISALSGSLVPSFFAVFIQAHVDRSIFGHIFPASMFQGINAFFVAIFCIPLSIIWIKMSQTKIKFSIFYILGVGLLLFGISYLSVDLGLVVTHNSAKINIFWIMLCYFLQALGFLLIAPVTISMIRKLSPIHLEGIILGAFSFSNWIAGLLSGVAMLYLKLPIIKNTNYQLTHGAIINTFGKLSLIPLIFATLILLTTFIINKKKSRLQKEIIC